MEKLNVLKNLGNVFRLGNENTQSQQENINPELMLTRVKFFFFLLLFLMFNIVIICIICFFLFENISWLFLFIYA